MKVGTPLKLKCMMVGRERLPKKGDGEYIRLTLQDHTGKIICPIWDNLDACERVTEIGGIYIVIGKRAEFQGPQISKEEFLPCDKAESRYNFIPRYEIPSKLFDYFRDYINRISDKRYVKLIQNILGIEVNKNSIKVVNKHRWEEFIKAPSAKSHHGNKIGGLFLHTIGVMKAIESFIKNYVDNPFFLKAKDKVLNVDRLRFLGIMHDYNKVDEYLYDLEIKYNDECKVPHPILFISTLTTSNIECGSLFTKEELTDIYLPILRHHGQWSRYQLRPNENDSLESILLHLADMVDSKLVGAIESSI